MPVVWRQRCNCSRTSAPLPTRWRVESAIAGSGRQSSPIRSRRRPRPLGWSTQSRPSVDRGCRHDEPFGGDGCPTVPAIGPTRVAEREVEPDTGCSEVPRNGLGPGGSLIHLRLHFASPAEDAALRTRCHQSAGPWAPARPKGAVSTTRRRLPGCSFGRHYVRWP